MTTICTLTRARATVGLALLLTTPATAPAQTFYGLAGGPDLHENVGFAAQASVGRQVAPRLGVRLDALMSQFTGGNHACLSVVPFFGLRLQRHAPVG